MSNASERIDYPSRLRQAVLALQKARAELDAVERARTEPIAIVGIGCRFPGGADDPEAFWRLLHDGVDAITEVPRTRWDVNAFYTPDPAAPGKMTTRWGGFLAEVDQFDAAFFGIAPREAVHLDPQHRLLLEVTWEALEHAGQAPDKLAESRTGVFIGISINDYLLLQAASDPAQIEAYRLTGNALNAAAGRLSHILGLRGPSMAVDTACSSSLVTMHLACQSLRAGECNLALAGGVNLILSPEWTITASKARMMAADGRCKAFDAAADGYVRGEGCGIVVLKRLADAVANGDNILALIVGSAVNHDGHSSGFTVPNKQAQEAVIREALANARVQPAQVSYVETHGTGTPLGDPIEVRALGAVLSTGRSKDQPLAIGSVKTNIGHLESAAGVAGLIKVVLALHHEEIPPHLHLRELNPYIAWDDFPVVVPTTPVPWRANMGERIAGVSSFGGSGTNAHVVVAAAPARQAVASDCERPCHLLTLSAKSAEALNELARRFARHLTSPPAASLADVCFTANAGRAHFPQRVAAIGASTAEVSKQLTAFGSGQAAVGVLRGQALHNSQPKVAFLFTGQGSQYVGMGWQLYNTHPVFRRALDRCDSLLRPHLKRPLLSVLYPESTRANDEQPAILNETVYTQPALFALEYALAELWRSWGLKSVAVMGHSVGEYVAACIAGVFSLEDGLKLIAERGRLMQALPPVPRGEMAAVFTDEARVAAAIAPYAPEVEIAALNGPGSIVISGVQKALQSVLRALHAQGIQTRPLQVSHAFHSLLMEPMLAAFEQTAHQVRFNAPYLPLVANVTGQLFKPGEVPNAAYWRRHVRETVRFSTGIATLRAQGYELFLEIGPSPTLLGMGRRCLPEGTGVWLREGRDDWQQILESLAGLYTRGVEVDWQGFDRDYHRRRVALPTYPFQGRRFWIDENKSRPTPHPSSKALHPLLHQCTRSPLLKEIIFESRLSTALFPYFDDHRVHGLVVLPLTAYLEIIWAATQTALGPGAHALQDVVMHEPLGLSGHEERIIQLVLTPDDGSTAGFQLISVATTRQGDKISWKVHMTGNVALGKTNGAPPEAAKQLAVEAVQLRCQEDVPIDTYYRQLWQRGLQFGPRFRGIERLWRRDGESLGQIRLAPELQSELGDYQLHPALLDACLQIFVAAWPSNGEQTADNETYLPLRLESYRFHKQPTAQMWSHVLVRTDESKKAESYTADVSVFDAEGFLVAELNGLVVKRASAEALQGVGQENIAEWLYEIAWRPKPLITLDARGSSPDDLPSLAQIVQHVHTQVSQVRTQAELAAYKALLPRLDALCSAYVWRAFQQLGGEFYPRQRYTTEAVARQLGVTDKYRRLLERMLEMLAEDSVLKRDGSNWEVCRVPDMANPEPHRQTLMDKYPDSTAELTLTASCGQHLAEVLRGEYDPLQLLFPGGSVELLEKLYQRSPLMRAMNRLVETAMAAVVANMPKDRPLRILELGAGTGGTTGFILPALRAKYSEYVFTDVSPLFLKRAAQKFCDYPFVRYQLVDVERDPGAQGFASHQFDVVIAANVLHATSDLRQTVRYVQRLLASGGLMILVEGTARERWVDLTFGLTEGWWKFTDVDLRPLHALLSQQKWLELLGELQFTETHAIAVTADGEKSGAVLAQQSMILARGPRVVQGVNGNVTTASRSGSVGGYVILTDRGGVGERLAGMLEAHGQSCILVSAGGEYEALDERHFAMDPSRPEDFCRLFAAAFGNDRGAYRGVIHLWNLDFCAQSDVALEQLHRAHITGTASVLHLVQAMIKAAGPEPLRLWVVTRGAQKLGSAAAPVEVVQSPVWGLGKVIALEHPELQCTRVDLDPSAAGQAAPDMADEIQMLCDEIWSRDKEDQVAFRGGTRHVARLVRSSRSAEDASRATAASAPVQLKIATRGALDGLKYQAVARRKPARGEVEIQVYATGLNFKDVLNALGMYPGDAGPLGGECAGKVVAVGEDVVDFKVGDAVMGIAPGSFSTFATACADLVIQKPEHLSFAEATTIPSAFMTAYYTLIHLGKLSADEKVLIHAAAGGVGLAAVQLAQRAGAEILATAGSPEKRGFLKALGVQHVMHSRSLDFAEEIMQITSGQGVDVVLNSLSGEFIPQSLRVLKDNGRFLEIGKRDIWDEKRVAQFKKVGAYDVVDLAETARENPAFIKSILHRVMAGFQDGSLKPLPMRVFPCAEVLSAFRHMQQAKHIGKIVVAPDEATSNRAAEIWPSAPSSQRTTSRASFRPDATYLITGGLAGLGLLTAQWMVERGGRHLVLMGRRGASETACAALGEMEKAGAQVVVAQGDVVQEKDVTRVLAHIKDSLPPLRGIIHSVGVLDDGALLQQNWERFTKVLAPKVDGAWLLHRLTQELPLDFFVLYSSVASLLGSRGQGNHASANAFLDALARHRRSQGQPAISIHWGAWSEIGAAAARRVDERIATQGIGAIAPREGLQALENVLLQDLAEVGVLPIDWSKYAQQFSADGVPPFLSELAREARVNADRPAVQQPEHLRRLAEASPTERRDFLFAYIRSQATKVLTLDPSDPIDQDRPLHDLGLDSLMALELRNLLGTGLGLERTLPATLLFNYPTISALAEYLAKQVLTVETMVTSKTEPRVELRGTPKAPTPIPLDRDELSEDQLVALLAKKLDQLG